MGSACSETVCDCCRGTGRGYGAVAILRAHKFSGGIVASCSLACVGLQTSHVTQFSRSRTRRLNNDPNVTLFTKFLIPPPPPPKLEEEGRESCRQSDEHDDVLKQDHTHEQSRHKSGGRPPVYAIHPHRFCDCNRIQKVCRNCCKQRVTHAASHVFNGEQTQGVHSHGSNLGARQASNVFVGSFRHAIRWPNCVAACPVPSTLTVAAKPTAAPCRCRPRRCRRCTDGCWSGQQCSCLQHGKR